MIKTLSELKEKAEGSKRKLVVADAAGKAVVDALKQAYEAGMINPILVGDREKIEPLVEEFGLTDAKIVHKTDEKEIAFECTELIRSGEGDMLMKGKLGTPVLMKAVLDKERMHRTSDIVSHVAVMEVSSYPKLMILTDGGIVNYPDLKDKVGLIANAVAVANGLGIEKPKVACLSAIEQITDKQPETLHAAALVKMCERGQLGKVVVEGPIAADVIFSHEAAKAKGIETEMTLDADIFLVPNIAVGNVLAKSLIYLANAKIAGLVMGAACPIVLLSRSDTAEIKLLSIALACVVAKKIKAF